MQFVLFLVHISTSLNLGECALSANLPCHLKWTHSTRAILKEVIDQQNGTSGRGRTYLRARTELVRQKKWGTGISVVTVDPRSQGRTFLTSTRKPFYTSCKS